MSHKTTIVMLDFPNNTLNSYNISMDFRHCRRWTNRSTYFYASAAIVIEILSALAELGSLNSQNVLDSIDAKIEEDDPIMLIKTDYTPY